MVDIGVRDALIQEIRRLSNKHPVAFLELIQPHQGNGAIKGTIVANAYEVFLEHNFGTTWPVDEIRALWLRSVDLIPDAIIRDAEPDGGFKEWIWLQTQRHWTARKEIGRAINPYMMWQSALVNGCAGEQIVSSNPLHATAIEITRIAEYADEVARTILKCEDEANQSRKAFRECCQARDAVDLQTNSLDRNLVIGKAIHAGSNYRDAEMRRVRIRSLAEVVTCYEMALIPHLFSARPAKDLATLEGVAHFRQVAVALANYANSKATSNLASDSNGHREEPPKQGDSRETAGKATIFREGLAGRIRIVDSSPPVGVTERTEAEIEAMIRAAEEDDDLERQVAERQDIIKGHIERLRRVSDEVLEGRLPEVGCITDMQVGLHVGMNSIKPDSKLSNAELGLHSAHYHAAKAAVLRLANRLGKDGMRLIEEAANGGSLLWDDFRVALELALHQSRHGSNKIADETQVRTGLGQTEQLIRVLPAEPATALQYLATSLSDLLCWAERPHPEPLNNDWWHNVRDDINNKVDAALRSIGHLRDEAIEKKLKETKRLAVSFASLMCDNPTLSTVRIQDWNIPRFRDQFNELSTLESEFKQLAKDFSVTEGGQRTSGPPKPTKPLPGGNDAGSKRRGRKPECSEVGHRRNTEELFKSGLRSHHKYQVGGSVMNFEPISPREMEKLLEGAISDSTALRLFNRHFGNINNYKRACVEGVIGRKLVVLLGDALHSFGTHADIDDEADVVSDD